jgi:hypothetical protein
VSDANPGGLHRSSQEGARERDVGAPRLATEGGLDAAPGGELEAVCHPVGQHRADPATRPDLALGTRNFRALRRESPDDPRLP